MGLRQVYERRNACRQAGVYQIVLQRFERPRASDLSNQQRLGSPRFSDGGSLDQLRFGKREPKLAGLRRDGQYQMCLMARRLIESGVRFIQVYSDGEWDAHNNLPRNHTQQCEATDVPISGLLTDLEKRGLFDSTLVICGGEFGRMPISQNGNGRDHNPNGFLQWITGAGVKGGVSYGASDDATDAR